MRSMKMRSGLAALALGALILSTAACATDSGTDTPAEPADGCEWAETDLSIGGGVTGGTYFVLGATLEKLIDEELDCATATTTSSAGTEAIRSNVDILLTQTDLLYISNTGEGGQGLQEGEQYPYQFAAIGYPNTSMILTRNDGSPQKLADYKSTDVIGTLGASTVPVLEAAAAAHGVSPQVTVIDSYDQMFTALRQGQITALHVVFNHPAVQILEAAETADLAAVYYDKDKLLEIRDEFPDYDVTTPVEAGTYKFLNEDYYTWSRSTTVGILESVDPALAKEITRFFFENNDAFVAVAPQAKMFNLDTLQSALDIDLIRTPFHPGAKEYYEEAGIKF